MQRRALAVATLVSLLVMYAVLRPFAGTLIASCVAAYVLAPVYSHARRRLRWPRLALPLTWVVGLVGFLAPLTVMLWMTVGQVSVLVEQVSTQVSVANPDFAGKSILEEADAALEAYVGADVSAAAEALQGVLVKAAGALGGHVLTWVSSLVGRIPRLITDAIVFFYAVTALLTGHARVLGLLERINPLGRRATEIYIAKADSMTAAMVKGQFVIALAQGLASALSLRIAGVEYFAFFLLLLSFLSLIPLGAGIVTIPIGIVLLLTGNPIGGIFVVLVHLLVVTNIDNVLRPRLVPRDAALNPALTIVSVLSGVALFGFFGIVVGPVLMILAVTTVETYADVVRAGQAEDERDVPSAGHGAASS